MGDVRLPPGRPREVARRAGDFVFDLDLLMSRRRSIGSMAVARRLVRSLGACIRHHPDAQDHRPSAYEQGQVRQDRSHRWSSTVVIRMRRIAHATYLRRRTEEEEPDLAPTGGMPDAQERSALPATPRLSREVRTSGTERRGTLGRASGSLFGTPGRDPSPCRSREGERAAATREGGQPHRISAPRGHDSKPP